MSYQERNIISYLITGSIVMSVFGYYMYGQYQLGLFDGPDAGSIIGWSALKLIGGSIILTIVVSIVTSIITAIVTQETDFDASDERDKQIDLIGMKVGFITFSTVFVGLMIWLALGGPMAYVLIASIYGMYIASLVEGGTRLMLYRRGF